MLTTKLCHRKGAMVVLIAVALIAFLVAVVFSVEIAYMQLTRTELRTAIDAAARAGTEALSRESNTQAAIDRAIEVASLNTVNGVSFTLPAEDITFGRVDIGQLGSAQFVAGETPPNALQITSGRTSDRPDGMVPLFLGRVLGVTQFEPIQTATAAQLDRDIALVLDRSGSMGSAGKLEALKQAVNVFLDEIEATPQTEHTSISVYNSVAKKLVDLTPDMQELRSKMNSVSSSGGTAIGLGLQKGIDSLSNDAQRRPLAEPTIVLMTDGQHNTSTSPENVIANAPVHFVVHTVTFGSGAEQQRMADLAAERNGKHFHAPDNATLIAIFREIGASLPVVMTK